MSKFDAVAFDVDGTLYHNSQFFIRLVPFIACNIPLIISFSKARKMIRKSGVSGDFYAMQAEICAKLLKKQDAAEIRTLIDERIYRGWLPLFKKVKLFKNVPQTLKLFKQNNIKLAILSDFPLGEKIKNLNLDGFWDVEICSEELGALKPHYLPFEHLIKSLGVSPERLLYVGNSLRYDIAGSKKAGIKAALIQGGTLFKTHRTDENPDFVFSDYRQLQHFVLE